MRVLAVGGGAREHAIVAALARSGAEVCVCMKNKNPGISRLAKEVLLADETDVPRVVEFATAQGAELAVVGPEAPLEAGLSDGLRGADIPTASPSKSAARIETSKSFMRELLLKHKVRGAVKFVVADDVQDVAKGIEQLGTDVVVKPTGLTGGKGVKVFGEHLMSKEDIMAYAEEIFSKRIGGSARIVLEERLVGEEFTVQAFCDGRRVVPMPAVQDHKRAYEGDKGPNTGGMGSYSQKDGLLPFLRKEEYDSAVGIMDQVVEALRSEGAEYLGTLYGQFMLTKDGPRVIEFNARFGDPEAQVLVMSLGEDLLPWLDASARGTLAPRPLTLLPGASVGVVLASPGYPAAPVTGAPISGVERIGGSCQVFHAGTAMRDGQLVTAGGRVLTVCALGVDRADAATRAYEAVEQIRFRGAQFRRDIGRAGPGEGA